MNDDAGGKSALSDGLGRLVVNGVTFEPMRLRVPQSAGNLSAELHVFSREMVLAIVAAERERCAKLCEAEYVGSSLTADDLVPCDEAYNMGLRHAAEAIRSA